MNPRTACPCRTNPVPCLHQPKLPTYKTELAHILGSPFRVAPPLAFSYCVSLAGKGGKSWGATGLRWELRFIRLF